MARKTYPVQDLKDKVNDWSRHVASAPNAKELRPSLTGGYELLESVLHETGNYRGYNYVSGTDMDDDFRVYY